MRTNRNEMIKACVQTDEKERYQKAAELLGLKDSELMREALREYIALRCPGLAMAA